MTTKLFALTFTILLLLFQPPLLLGQNVPEQQGWEAVQALVLGSNLLVETKDGKRHKGKLNSASVTALTLTRRSGTTNLNKVDIQKVYQLNGGSRATSTLLGTGIGAGVGAGAAAILLGATGGSDDTSGIVTKGILIGAVLGAVVGLVAGKGSRRILIYESR